MTVKLMTKRHLELLSLKGAAQARPSVHLSKYHIVVQNVNRMSWLIRSRCEKTCLRGFANSKCPDQPARPRRLTSAFFSLSGK